MDTKLTLMSWIALRNGADIEQVTAVAECSKAEMYKEVRIAAMGEMDQ